MYSSIRFVRSGVLLLNVLLAASISCYASTIPFAYQFTGAAQNLVIANGFLDADGTASGSVNGLSGVAFDTHNHIDLSTLQNYGTFTIAFPDGDTVFGTLHEDDIAVSLSTSSGPFTQTLNFTGGTGQFENASGSASGGGNIYPTYYTTSGTGNLSAPGATAVPEPAPFAVVSLNLLIGAFFGLRKTLPGNPK